jgi:hypothetical protein
MTEREKVLIDVDGDEPNTDAIAETLMAALFPTSDAHEGETSALDA